eukprot:6506254-Alexandrium_andersonii.AAC.1
MNPPKAPHQIHVPNDAAALDPRPLRTLSVLQPAHLIHKRGYAGFQHAVLADEALPRHAARGEGGTHEPGERARQVQPRLL